MSAQGIIVGLQTLHVVGATKYCKKYCSEDVYKKVLADRNKAIKESFKIALIGILPVPVGMGLFFHGINNDNEFLALIGMFIALIFTISLLIILAFRTRNSTLSKNSQ